MKFFNWLSKNKSEIVKGIILFIFVEFVLWIIFFLPPNIKENLVLHKSYTNFIDLLGNHYVHENTQHILGNSIGFILITFPLFVFLLKFEKNNKTFYKLMLMNLILVPVLVSMIMMQANRNVITSIERTMGFSAINASLMGSFAITYVYKGLSHFKFKKFFSFLSIVFLVTLTLVLTYSRYLSHDFLAKIIPVLSILILSCITLTFVTIPNEVKKKIAKHSANRKYMRIAFFYQMMTPYLIAVLYSIVLFPTNFIINDTIIGFYNHFVGFILGSVIMYAFYECSERKNQSRLFN